MLHQNLFVASQGMLLAMFQCSEGSHKFYSSNPVLYVGQSIKRPDGCSMKVFLKDMQGIFLPAFGWL